MKLLASMLELPFSLGLPVKTRIFIFLPPLLCAFAGDVNNSVWPMMPLPAAVTVAARDVLIKFRRFTGTPFLDTEFGYKKEDTIVTGGCSTI